MTYEASTIAKWFVAYASNNDADRSNLKIQKLLYYAQGHHLALYNGQPLFEDEIQAWAHGPVVPAIYREYKQFGSGDIDLDEADEFDFSQVDGDTASFLVDVWDAYGQFGAWHLRQMTHSEPPWKEAFQKGANVSITRMSIQKYFETRV